MTKKVEKSEHVVVKKFSPTDDKIVKKVEKITVPKATHVKKVTMK